MTTDSASLKQRHRAVRDTQPEALRVRIHRAISWLARAEQEGNDMDARFLFLWIALNAAYASEFGFEHTERDQARTFVGRLLALDIEKRLHAVLFQQFTGPIRTLIENKFVFDPFWKALREHDSSGHWEQQFIASRKVALRALMDKQTELLLSIVLDRLHTLRNQIVHGGATWNGGANRPQVKDGAQILGSLLPIVIDLMITNDNVEFDEIAYPPFPGW